jgi:hypothetical protein
MDGGVKGMVPGLVRRGVAVPVLRIAMNVRPLAVLVSAAMLVVAMLVESATGLGSGRNGTGNSQSCAAEGEGSCKAGQAHRHVSSEKRVILPAS